LPEKDSRLILSITPETEWEDVVGQVCRLAPELNHLNGSDGKRLKTFFELRMRNMGGDDVTEGMRTWRIETDELNGGLFYKRRGEVIGAIVAPTESPEAKEMATRRKRK